MSRQPISPAMACQGFGRFAARALAVLSVGLAANATQAVAGALYIHAAYAYDDLPFGNALMEGDGDFTVAMPNGNFTASADFSHALLTAGLQLTSYNTSMGTVQASAGMQYDVTITVTGSGYGGDAVPFVVSGFTQLEASGNANSTGSLQVIRSPFDQGDASLRSMFRGGIQTNSCGIEGGTQCGHGALLVIGSLAPYWSDASWVGQTMQVKLLARTAVQANNVIGIGFGYSTGSALVDPVIQVDPAYVDAHPNLSYSVNLNPAIPNAVPEPGSAAMLLCGLGLVALAARRRASGQR